MAMAMLVLPDILTFVVVILTIASTPAAGGAVRNPPVTDNFSGAIIAATSLLMWLMVAMVSVSSMADDSEKEIDSQSEDSSEEVCSIQQGKDVEWEMVKTARSGKDGLLTTHGCFTYHRVRWK